MSKNVTLVILFSIAAAVIGLYTYYNITLPPLEETQQNPTVAASIFPVYDIARNVAGSAVEVKLLLPPGASPHTFEPTPSILKELQGADVLYTVGHGADNWATDLLSDLGVAEMTVDRQITLREYGAQAEGGHEHEGEMHEDEHEHEDEMHEDEHGHSHEGNDPHYWLSIPNAKQIARNIADDMTARWPNRAEQINTNLANYIDALDQADQEMRQALQNIENNNIVTLHDAWYYFAEEYDLEITATFEPTPGREPTPHYLATLGHAVDESGVSVIYSEPQLSTDTLEQFVADHGINIAVLDPLGGVLERDSYINMMKYNAQTIAQNQ